MSFPPLGNGALPNLLAEFEGPFCSGKKRGEKEERKGKYKKEGKGRKGKE